MNTATAKIIINQVYAARGVANSGWTVDEYREALRTKLND